MARPIRILLIEDDVDDHLIIRDLLSGKAAGGVQLDWVADYDAGLETLLQAATTSAWSTSGSARNPASICCAPPPTPAARRR